VDVEEYFHVSAFERILSSAEWWRYPSRVEMQVVALLELLARAGSTATFFCLGWVARRHPRLVRSLVEAGHEVASHGWWHRRVTTISPGQFAYEVRASKALLEDVTGREVLGYRAPSFSIVPGREWALDILLDQGYRYDSSLFPIRRRGYGYPGTPSGPHERALAGGTLVELPPATLGVLGMRIPAGGGGYLRQFPLAVIRAALRQHARRGIPAMLYIHPWEIDPAQPRLPVGPLTRLRHYRGLDQTTGRLAALMLEFRFTSAAEYLSAAPLALRTQPSHRYLARAVTS
jgi:polysaccharide deacetylase family protein (PEP-CTERM system associated)